MTAGDGTSAIGTIRAINPPYGAPLVMLARVAMGAHYLSDVIGGAVLGILFGVLFVVVL